MKAGQIIKLTDRFFDSALSDGLIQFFPTLSTEHTYEILEVKKLPGTHWLCGAKQLKCLETNAIYDVLDVSHLPEEEQAKCDFGFWCFFTSMEKDEYEVIKDVSET